MTTSPTTGHETPIPSAGSTHHVDGNIVVRSRRILTSLREAITPVAIALAVGALVMRVSGIDPFATYALMAENAFGSVQSIGGTLTSSTPLLFTGVATAVAFRAGVFSLGAESGFVLGGLTAAWLSLVVDGPAAFVIIVAILGAVAVGAIYSLPAAWLRVKYGVDEVVSTLMLSFAAAGIAAWIVNSFLLAPGSANSATPAVTASLPRLMPPATLNIGFLIALALIVAYAVVLRRTRAGLELHHTGVNPQFTAAQGISTGRVIFYAMLTTGAVAAIGGAVHALGVVGRFVGTGFSAEYGFTGIAIALLARRSALAIVPAALLFGAFANAGSTIQLFADIPLDIIDILQGTVMMFAIANFAAIWRRRKKVREKT